MQCIIKKPANVLKDIRLKWHYGSIAHNTDVCAIANNISMYMQLKTIKLKQ